MQLQTKFNLGQMVLRDGTAELGIVTEIDISVTDARNTPTITYTLYHGPEDNGGASFGGMAYESELKLATDQDIRRIIRMRDVGAI